MLPPCPHCGDTQNGVYRKVRAFGWVEEFFHPDGSFDMQSEGINFTSSKTAWCAGCYRVRRDVTFVGREAVAKGQVQ